MCDDLDAVYNLDAGRAMDELLTESYAAAVAEGTAIIFISTPSGVPGYFFKTWHEMVKASEVATFSEVSSLGSWDPKDEWVDIVDHTGDHQTRHVLDYDATTDVLTVDPIDIIATPCFGRIDRVRYIPSPEPPAIAYSAPRRGGKGRGRGRADWNKTNRGY
jgi:hypothetical protein